MLFNSTKHHEQTIRKEAIWTLSNITAGTPSHIENIIENHDYLEVLFYVGINDSLEVIFNDFFERLNFLKKVRREVAFTFFNALKNANQEQVRALIDKGMVEYFGKLLEEEGDMNIPGIGLRGIKEMLSTGAICWSILEEESNIMMAIERLQNSENLQIAELTCGVLDFAGDAFI